MELLKIENLSIKNKEKILFNNFNLQINDDTKLGIYAPSGSGKSTLLNYISDNLINNTDLQILGHLQKKENLKISYVYQDFRLLEHISVFENVYLPLENVYKKNEAKKIALDILNKVFLEDKINQKVKNLSGGEKQRVAIARAFSFPFDLLLLDEAFHAQDKIKKQKLLLLTKNLIKNSNKALIMVSHNKEELQELCDKIIDESSF